MSELLTKAQELIILKWLIIARIAIFSLVALGMAWQTAVANLDISQLSRTQIVNIMTGMFVIWGTTMGAFFDQSIRNVASGKLPGVTNGNTDIIKKDEKTNG
jgi:hypothetical protein